MPIVLAASIGTALSSASITWAQVTTPGMRLSETSSAFGPNVEEAG